MKIREVFVNYTLPKGGRFPCLVKFMKGKGLTK